MKIRPAVQGDFAEWLRLRQALWPECSLPRHQREMADILEDSTRQAILVAELDDGGLCGFLEASLRLYAEGCETSPVGYIEGWYLAPDQRKRGFGRALVQAAEAWAAQKGCHEMASDCLIDNQPSRLAHLSLGYEEAERLIHFRKSLTLEARA